MLFRSLTLSGLPSSQKSWVNQHIVYTHGYGVVASVTDQVDKQGEPLFVEKDLPPSGVLGSFEPRIYYGQMSPSYSIVGAPAGSAPREFDRPASNLSGQVDNTHSGGGGVPIGSTFRKLVYAIKYRSSSILFSSAVNKDSQLLSIRNQIGRASCRERV